MKVTLYSSFSTTSLAQQAMLALKLRGARPDDVSAFFPLGENSHQFSCSPQVGVLGEGALATAWKQSLDGPTTSGIADFLTGQGLDDRFARDAEQAIGHANAILVIDCAACRGDSVHPDTAGLSPKPFGMLHDDVSLVLKEYRAGLVVQLPDAGTRNT